MSKPVSPTLIGIFVVGALTLLIVTIAIFGSMTFFTKSVQCVLLFESSVSGLSLGAPVVFRGVPIGTVSEITISNDLNAHVFVAPVYVNFKKSATNFITADTDEELQVTLNKLFKEGLRARLTSQSLITGQLMIELDFFKPNELSKEIDSMPMYNDTPQIPVIPSRIESLFQRFDSLPIKGIGQNILELTKSLAHILQKTEETHLQQEIVAAVKEFRQMTTNIDILATETKVTMQNITHITSNIDDALPKMKRLLQKSFANLDTALLNANTLIQSLQTTMRPTSPTMVNLQRSLFEVAEAARAIRSLANTLELQPEMLLRGRILQP